MFKTVTVTYLNAEDVSRERLAAIERGQTLLDAGHVPVVNIEATCGTWGRCRTCCVKILKGEVPPPTIQDTVQLGHEEVRENFRLACQTKLIGDTTVLALPPRAEVGYKILSYETSV